jgi:hypothetical protein
MLKMYAHLATSTTIARGFPADADGTTPARSVLHNRHPNASQAGAQCASPIVRSGGLDRPITRRGLPPDALQAVWPLPETLSHALAVVRCVCGIPMPSSCTTYDDVLTLPVPEFASKWLRKWPPALLVRQIGSAPAALLSPPRGPQGTRTKRKSAEMRRSQ